LSNYEDVLYEQRESTVTVTVNRPQVMNAYRSRTYGEVADAILTAGWDPKVSAIVLTGAGGKAFGTGGDTNEKKSERKGGFGTVGVPVELLHAAIRDVPKPVIAKVRGYAIGGGNVIATICDLTMGSVDPGYGTAFLARIVGEKKAREFWYLCRRYSAREAMALGLVNAVVPDDQLDEEVDRWCNEIAQRSPTAIAIAKRSFNADSENIRGIASMGYQSLALYYQTAESKEGGNARREKRPARFRDVMNENS
jgi:2-ketocyclohexanecarboxyl-CoA hydrolase